METYIEQAGEFGVGDGDASERGHECVFVSTDTLAGHPLPVNALPHGTEFGSKPNRNVF